MYDYANILFTGKSCNLGCYGCIGSTPSLRNLPHNLDQFPLENIDGLIKIVNRHKIRDLAFTGTNVDPQMYRYEPELIRYVRARITGSTNLSLHTNGLLALEKIDAFNSYDKASVSLHSYNPETYARMTTAKKMPDIKGILQESAIPIKLSMLITRHNIEEIDDYVRQSAGLGIKRIVVRKLKDREEEFPLENMRPFKEHSIKKTIFSWPVYEIYGVEVTVCGFDKSTAKGIFLFSDGRLEERLV